MAAAGAVLDTLEQEDLPARAWQMGEYIQERLRERLGMLPQVRTIRGRGLMIGIELSDPAPTLVRRALEKGILVNVTAERVIRLLPPLTISPSEADLLVARLHELLEEGV